MARTRSTAQVIACLGDSLTYGAQTPEILHPWTDLLNADLPPHLQVANYGKNGDVLSGMTTRYELAIRDRGFVGVHLLVPVNDVQLETPASTILAELNALIDDMLYNELVVFLGVTPPAGGFATWNPTKQGILETVRTAMLAREGVTPIDYYGLMGEPNNPTHLREEYAYSDELHLGHGGARFVADTAGPILLAQFPAPAVPGPVSSWG